MFVYLRPLSVLNINAKQSFNPKENHKTELLLLSGSVMAQTTQQINQVSHFLSLLSLYILSHRCSREPGIPSVSTFSLISPSSLHERAQHPPQLQDAQVLRQPQRKKAEIDGQQSHSEHFIELHPSPGQNH